MFKFNIKEHESIVLHSQLERTITLKNQSGWALTNISNFSENYYLASFIYLGRSVFFGLNAQKLLIDKIAQEKLKGV